MLISFDEGPQALLRHIGYEFIEQTALPKQGMDAAFGCAGSQLSIHAEAFAGGAQQRQQQDGEGVEEQETVAALGIADPLRAHAHCEAQILAVAKTGFDAPAFGVELDDLRSGARAVAGGQAPGLLHARGFYANNRSHFLTGGGNFRIAQLTRPAALPAWRDCRRRSRFRPPPRRFRAAALRAREPTSRTAPRGPRPKLLSNRSTCLIADLATNPRAAATA